MNTVTPVRRDTPPPHLRRVSRLAGCLVLLALPACSPKSAPTEAKAEAKAVTVTVAPAKLVPLKRSVTGVGTLHAHEDVMVATKVDGRVTRVFKNAGDFAYPGEVLLELDPTNFALAVGQARPAFEGELRKLKLDALPDSDAAFAGHLSHIDTVAQARANLELAEKELARAEVENSRGVGSVQVLDAARTKVKVARTAVDLAETDARVTLAQARRLKAVLDEAEDKLRETQLRAPVPDEWGAWAAVVGPAANPVRYAVAARMVAPGTVIPPMQVKDAFRLVLDHTLKLRAPVPEKHQTEVRPGQPVGVRTEAYPGVVFPGRVARVFPTVDEANRTFVVEVEVPNCARKLKAGGFASADILVRTDDTVLTVPPEALVTFAGVTKVFVADGERARAVEVEVGARDRDWVEVRGDLTAGAKVVTTGQNQLVEGSVVRVR
jgi:multidrug efflux pump subunit AcrA (membrane-fusion protein)